MVSARAMGLKSARPKSRSLIARPVAPADCTVSWASMSPSLSESTKYGPPTPMKAWMSEAPTVKTLTDLVIGAALPTVASTMVSGVLRLENSKLPLTKT